MSSFVAIKLDRHKGCSQDLASANIARAFQSLDSPRAFFLVVRIESGSSMTGQEASNETHREFEQYLAAQGVPWEPIPVGHDRSADYLLSSTTSQVICEVKALVGGIRRKVGGYGPCKPIVRKIRKARPQLHGAEEEPRCIVLNSKSVHDSLDPTVVASAAFGPGYTNYRPDHSVIDGSPPVLRFSRRRELPEDLWHLANASLSPAYNTRISALVNHACSRIPFRLQQL